jgi:glycosyltransferase involved in cell wall biosynthesis
VIITDDGSTDKVTDFIQDLLHRAKFKVKHVYQIDKGFRKTRALNNAVRNCSGDYLIFLDQDLIFPEDLIEKIIYEKKKGRFLMFRAALTSEEDRNELIKKIESGETYEKGLSYIPNDEKLKESFKMIKKDKRNNFLYSMKLRKRGSKLVGMLYSLYKKDYVKINGYDEKYQGWGYEDDDLGNRLYKAKIKSKPIFLKNVPLHLWHPFDPTKKKSSNEEYYYTRKKEINNRNYRCEYGYDESIEDDLLIIKELKI